MAVCAPTTRSYSVASVPGALSYTWTAPANATIVSGQNTTSVTVSFSNGFTFGNLCVKANNACGSSAPSCKLITGAVPAPGPITGLNSVCKNASNLLYSVSPVTGAVSYTWTVLNQPKSQQVRVEL